MSAPFASTFSSLTDHNLLHQSSTKFYAQLLNRKIWSTFLPVMGWEPYFKTGWATIDGARVRAIAKERDLDRKLVRVTPVHHMGLLAGTTAAPSYASEIPESQFEVLSEDRSPAER